jgi:hypothetical protein
MDSFESEEELLPENGQCPGLKNCLQDYAMKSRSPETEGDSNVQQTSKRSCSSSSEEVEVEECLPEEPDSDGLDSGGLDTDHSFCQEARAIIPRIKVETRSYRF